MHPITRGLTVLVEHLHVWPLGALLFVVSVKHAMRAPIGVVSSQGIYPCQVLRCAIFIVQEDNIANLSTFAYVIQFGLGLLVGI